MFFGNLRMRCEQHGKNQCKKKEHHQHSSVFKVV